MSGWPAGGPRNPKKKEIIFLNESAGIINCIRWPGGIYRMNLYDFGDVIEIKDWICDNLSRKTKIRMKSGVHGQCRIYFKTEEDAVAFKLRWI